MESWTFRGEKPPLGAKPYYIAYVERIYDLADAIRRTDDVDDIRYYISEIHLCCEMIKQMAKVEKDRRKAKESADD